VPEQVPEQELLPEQGRVPAVQGRVPAVLEPELPE
jgi:hypothetical protein